MALDGWRSVNANGFQSGNMVWNWQPMYSFVRWVKLITLEKKRLVPIMSSYLCISNVLERFY